MREQEESTKRIEWVDILKGLAIILVVIGHMPYEPGSYPLNSGIYSFHMQLFMMLAGYTAALSMKRSASVGSFVYKRFIGIFIPYLVWCFMVPPFAQLNTYQAYSFADRLNYFAVGNVLYWFLPCLLMLQLLFSLYTAVTAHTKSAIAKVCLAVGVLIVATILHRAWGECHSGTLDKWDLAFLTRTYRFIIPFSIGVALFQYPRFMKLCMGPLVCAFCVLIVLLFAGVWQDKLLPIPTPHMRTIVGTAASLLLIRMFSGRILPEWVNQQLKAIGKDTLIIYLVSDAFIPETCTWFQGMEGTMAFLVYLPICVAICYFCMAIGRMISTSPWLSLLMQGKPLQKNNGHRMLS